MSPSRRAIIGSVPVGNGPSSMTTGDDAIWAANTIQGTVARIDPRDNRVVATIPIGRRLGAVTFAGGIVWAAVQAPEATAGAMGKIVFDDSGDLYAMNADGTGGSRSRPATSSIAIPIGLRMEPESPSPGKNETTAPTCSW
jgi:DNA-binding beta-propeller fold protein YncE